MVSPAHGPVPVTAPVPDPMPPGRSARLAVLGHPISHSLSPVLHAAAAQELGLDWDYRRFDVQADQLEAFVAQVRHDWLGLSLTMPLKRPIVPLLDRRDALVTELQVANTVRFEDGALHGANTDVIGFEWLLRGPVAAGCAQAVLLGSGATALSAFAALDRVGVHRVTSYARTPGHADPLRAYAAAHGLTFDVELLDRRPSSAPADAVVISTLPPGAADGLRFHPVAGQLLIDVSYGAGTAPLVASWRNEGGRAHDGTALLIEQALAQDAFFLTGDPRADVPGLDRARAAMQAAVAR